MIYSQDVTSECLKVDSLLILMLLLLSNCFGLFCLLNSEETSKMTIAVLNENFQNAVRELQFHRKENIDLYYFITSNILVTYFKHASLAQYQIKIDLAAQ